ncbi:MAG: hypothetical protein IKW46_07580 [Bacteroidaceae bacterium]|nr:hypothetical protein [Bacteroidaceae bacterium]
MRKTIAEIIRVANMHANPLGQVGFAEADALIANDVVKVVRCTDCEYARILGKYGCHCLNANTPWHNDEFEVYMGLSDFCSYGVRKDGADNE